MTIPTARPEEMEVMEAIRKRPGMYTGGTDKYGLHHLLFWALDDIAGNARAGRGTKVVVRLCDDGDCEIRDDGPAVAPGEPPTPETVHALTGSDQNAPSLPRGVISDQHCRNYLLMLRALSSSLAIYAQGEGRQVKVRYRRANLQHGRERPDAPSDDGPATSFTTRFRPDSEIFGDAAFDVDMVRERLRQVAATAGIRCELRCEATDTAEDLSCPNGMADLLRSRIVGDDPGCLFPDGEPFRITVSEPRRSLDVALLWPQSDCAYLPTEPHERIASWANTVRTRDGTHVAGLLDALRSAGALRPYPIGVISVFLPAPRLLSPVKDRLANLDIRRFVSDHVGAALRRYVESDSEFGLDILRPEPIPPPTGEGLRRAITALIEDLGSIEFAAGLPATSSAKALINALLATQEVQALGALLPDADLDDLLAQVVRQIGDGIQIGVASSDSAMAMGLSAALLYVETPAATMFLKELAKYAETAELREAGAVARELRLRRTRERGRT